MHESKLLDVTIRNNVKANPVEYNVQYMFPV